jgi:hypothetical protein
MNNLKLIMFLCILNQGCSSGSHEQINQPVSAIHALEAAPLATLSSEQTINPDIDGAPRLQIDADEVIYENGESVEEAEKGQAESDGSIESASDNTDFLPKPPSYWM